MNRLIASALAGLRSDWPGSKVSCRPAGTFAAAVFAAASTGGTGGGAGFAGAGGGVTGGMLATAGGAAGNVADGAAACGCGAVDGVAGTATGACGVCSRATGGITGRVTASTRLRARGWCGAGAGGRFGRASSACRSTVTCAKAGEAAKHAMTVRSSERCMSGGNLKQFPTERNQPGRTGRLSGSNATARPDLVTVRAIRQSGRLAPRSGPRCRLCRLAMSDAARAKRRSGDGRAPLRERLRSHLDRNATCRRDRRVPLRPHCNSCWC